jgi:hypothetical protein
MKMLVCIPSYGLKNRKYLEQLLKEYTSFKDIEIDVHLFLTDDIQTSYTKHFYHPSIGTYLAYEYRQVFYENRNNYDWFFFSEDDLLVTEKALLACIEESNKLELPNVCGLLRYELKENSNYKYLIDHHPAHSVHRQGGTIIKSIAMIDGGKYLDLYNVHQGCNLLNPKSLQIALDSGNYFKHCCEDGYAHSPLESALADVYYKCGLRRLIPMDRVSDLLVHHLPEKYVTMNAHIYTEQIVPNEVKFQNTVSIF